MAWCNRCPRPRSMTTECTWTGLAQLRHDTQQWSRALSIAHGILNACESWNKFFSFWRRIFLKKIQFFFLNTTFLHQKYVPSSKKSSKEHVFLKNQYFARKRIFLDDFCLDKFKKKGWKTLEKTKQKEKKRKTQQTQKIKRTIEK